MKRYTIKERLVSDYGQGAFPKHRAVSYVVVDNKSGHEVNALSTRGAAEAAIEARKKRLRKRKEKDNAGG